MEVRRNKIDFSNQSFYIGIDVHKKNWNITIRSNHIVLKTISISPEANELRNHMEKHYPKGNYYSVYEAGYSGYGTHRELEKLGFHNIIVSPTNIPTSSKERLRKTDEIDSRKLARELENGSLRGIYVPTIIQQEIRSLSRLRYQTVKKQTRIKNQIKSYLQFYGHKIPLNTEIQHWSRRFIERLRGLPFEYETGREQLEIYIEELLELRSRLLKIVRSMKKYTLSYKMDRAIRLLTGIPGIGFVTATTLYTEIMDIGRFKNSDKLASYVGLTPSTRSSGEREKVMGLSFQFNRYLRSLLIESSWIAIRKDPAMTLAYNNYTRRMSKQESIIRIAKKLLNRSYYNLKNNREYVCSVVK